MDRGWQRASKLAEPFFWRIVHHFACQAVAASAFQHQWHFPADKLTRGHSGAVVKQNEPIVSPASGHLRMAAAACSGLFGLSKLMAHGMS